MNHQTLAINCGKMMGLPIPGFEGIQPEIIKLVEFKPRFLKPERVVQYFLPIHDTFSEEEWHGFRTPEFKFFH